MPPAPPKVQCNQSNFLKKKRMKLKHAKTMRQSKSRGTKEKTYDNIIEWESDENFTRGFTFLEIPLPIDKDGPIGMNEGPTTSMNAFKRKRKRTKTLTEIRKASGQGGVDFPYSNNNQYGKEERLGMKKGSDKGILKIDPGKTSRNSTSKMESFTSEHFGG
jgi:hypothetical protein